MDKSAKAARLADQLRDYLSLWVHQDNPGVLITVTDIQLTPNGLHATVWLTGFDEAARRAANEIGKQAGRYQHRLRGALQRQLIPTLRFIVETEGTLSN